MIEICKTSRENDKFVVDFKIRIDPVEEDLEETTIKEITQLIRFKGSEDITISSKEILYREFKVGPDSGSLTFHSNKSEPINNIAEFILKEFNNAGINATDRSVMNVSSK